MLIAGQYNNFRVYGTDSFDLNLGWKDEDGNLFDLTGWHARMRLFVSFSDRTQIIEITDGDGITLGDGTSSPNIACHIDDEDVESFSAQPGYLTLEVEDPDANWDRLLEGRVRFEP